MREKEMKLIVDDLQDEQKIAKEKLALYSLLTMKLKRELLSEKLAHIDSKKEIEDLRAKAAQAAPSSPEQSPQDAEDPWNSPEKISGEPPKSSRVLSFGSFYSSSRGPGVHGEEDEPSSPSSGIQPLRNSLLGQYLPSSLLDSPQTGVEHPKTFDEDEDEDNQTQNDTIRDDRVCAQCGAAVSTVEPLSQFPDQIGSPKNDRDVSTTRKSSDHQSQQKGSRIAVSPVTLSLLTELFETIPLDELEAILKECSGQASLAIERILQTHVSFNPTLVADSSAPPASTSKTVSSTSNTQSSNWKTELCMYYLQGKCNKTRRTCSFAHGENDLVRSTSSKHVPSTSYKTRMCPLYLEGNCPKSRRECSMAHGEADLREGLPALNAATSTLPATTPPRLQNYKTELCYYFLKGCCNYTKEECRFAHGESDLRTVESNTLEWSSQRNNASASSFQNEFVPGSHSSPAASAMDKMQQLQHQHQYQQQYQQQAQAYQMQQGFVAPGHHQLPQQHQLPPHQFAHGPGQHLHQQVALQHHHQSLPQQPAMPPQHQQGMYHAHANAAQPPPPFRYMKGGEEMNKRGRPQPRRENSWSGSYDGMHTPGMPPSDF
ncbi:TPA: hypothetical protein N0F65_008303 [Lagenidium giganteum]|uniref:C3H1-type domain-containing protein n=1 Tax=Lagenidium giganteum TaxID=4803 RepID=A0AAV2YQA4_9STRA|nr:TPA: hypothetical protein N0F65_008303 [Lagenidium giganteum]